MSGPQGRGVAAAGLVVVVLLTLAGVLVPSGPETDRLSGRHSVLLISVPGLRWTDLDAVDLPHISELATARGLLSVRSTRATTDAEAGYLSLNSGNRLAADGDATLAGACADLVDEARDEAARTYTDAEPGALGDALRSAGFTTRVFGSPAAVLGLMGGDGCVDEHRPGPVDVQDVPAGTVTLIELPGLARQATAGERGDTLRRIDAEVGALLGAAGDAAVILFSPYGVGDRNELTAIAVHEPAAGRRSGLASATTRRAPYVTLADVAPTVLGLVGAPAPSSMTGTPIRVVPVAEEGEWSSERLAELTRRTDFRDRAVGPLSVAFVVLMSLSGLLALAHRARLARPLATITAAFPLVAFGSGLVAYHRLPLDFLVVATLTVAATIAAMAVAFLAKFGWAAPVGALAGLTWLLLLGDVITGGRLQLDTVLGYSPAVAGRFQGFGNLAFGLFAAAAMVVAVAPALTPPALSRQILASRRSQLLWVLFVGAVTIVADAAPAFGSDVGGTLALVAAFALVAMTIAGRRLTVARVAVAGAAGVAVLAVLAIADHARDESQRTHLGRFVQRLLDGGATTVIGRKIRANLEILSGFWSIVLLVLLTVAAVLAVRRRAGLARALEGRDALRWFLVGAVTVAVAGMALNDSGIAVPGIMLGIVIPWLVAQLMPPVLRRGRE